METYTFQYLIKNKTQKQAVFTVDCSLSVGMLYSERGGRITKMVMPDETTFMLNCEAETDAIEFTLAASVSW